MVEWLRLVIDSLETWAQFLHDAESCCTTAILCGTEPVSAVTRALFLLLRTIYIFFLDFVSGDLVLTGF